MGAYGPGCFQAQGGQRVGGQSAVHFFLRMENKHKEAKAREHKN